MLDRINQLERDVGRLDELVQMVDDYSKHFMAQTLTMLGIIISLATVIIVGALFFMIKSLINQKMDNEVEKRILKILGEEPPVYHARGVGVPDENRDLVLSSEIIGIQDLEPKTLLTLDMKVERITYGQVSSSLRYNLYINSQGERVVHFDNYYHSDKPDEGNGQVTWALVWVRKYNN